MSQELLQVAAIMTDQAEHDHFSMKRQQSLQPQGLPGRHELTIHFGLERFSRRKIDV